MLPKESAPYTLETEPNLTSSFMGLDKNKEGALEQRMFPTSLDLGSACEIASNNLNSYSKDIKALRDKLHRNIVEGLGEERVKLNGHPDKRLPNTLNISISGVIGENLLSKFPRLLHQLAQHAMQATTKPSAVLLAMGLSNELALGTLRLSLGRWSTVEEVDEASRLIVSNALRQ